MTIALVQDVDRRVNGRLFVGFVLDLDDPAVEGQLQFADLERVAVFELGRLGQFLTVDKRAARASQVLDLEARPGSRDDRMLARDRLGLQDHVAIRIAADDHHIAIQLVQPAGHGAMHDLECRDDALRSGHVVESTPRVTADPSGLCAR